jgi:hypothetical protein
MRSNCECAIGREKTLPMRCAKIISSEQKQEHDMAKRHPPPTTHEIFCFPKTKTLEFNVLAHTAVPYCILNAWILIYENHPPSSTSPLHHPSQLFITSNNTHITIPLAKPTHAFPNKPFLPTNSHAPSSTPNPHKRTVAKSKCTNPRDAVPQPLKSSCMLKSFFPEKFNLLTQTSPRG